MQDQTVCKQHGKHQGGMDITEELKTGKQQFPANSPNQNPTQTRTDHGSPGVPHEKRRCDSRGPTCTVGPMGRRCGPVCGLLLAKDTGIALRTEEQLKVLSVARRRGDHPPLGPRRPSTACDLMTGQASLPGGTTSRPTQTCHYNRPRHYQ
ncbi:hypothetical protein NDU88_006922 [Pleurodeles waltl]|uniref:Uncharacterized protein n=1 Tax=Pleurodeles waltl TaxID=8319 RepID=A0AAV7LQI7_PLEWA|nr:hypothetical protein NDU88_006922 [Pleurodeles waltl]